MRVVFDIPDPVWARLAEVADQRGTKVGRLLSEAAVGLTHGPAKDHGAAIRKASVERLVREGFSDGEIAERLHMSRQWVAEVRRSAGLAPNHRPGRSGGINGRNKR